MINIFKYFCILVFCSVLFSIPGKVYCLEALSKNEMKTTTGQRALTDFSTTGNTARMYINTHIETYTEIESMKLGHYDRTNHGLGWDQNWTGLDFGNSTDDPLKMDGFIIKAEFKENLNQNSTPELQRLIIGTNKLNGTISGNFESFTGAFNPALIKDENDPYYNSSEGVIYTREPNLGNKEFEFSSSPPDQNQTDQNQGFFLILSPDTANHSGIHSIMGYTEEHVESLTDNNSNWWNSP